MRSILILMLLVFVTACTPMIYGVPQERWDLMTENERIAAMEAYKARQIAYQQAAAERARIRAEQEALRRAQLEEELRRRQERVDMIYEGRTGAYGDLLEVTISDGLIKLHGRRSEYFPVTFALADGEVKAVPIQYTNGQVENLYVSYEDRHLWLDTDDYGQNTRRAGHLIYNQNWKDGVAYSGINSHGSRDMRNISVFVEVLPMRRGHSGHRRPDVIIREKVVQAPPQVIVKEKIVQAPPQVIVKEKIVQAPPQVIVKEKIVVKEPGEASSKDQREQKGEQKNESGDKYENHRKESRQPDEVTSKEGGRKEEGRIPSSKDSIASRTANVVLNGGQVLIDGKHRPFKPVKFTITEGETKNIDLSSNQVASTVSLDVSFIDGVLYLDGTTPGKKNAGNNKSAKNVESIKGFGSRSLKNVNMRIEYR